MIIYQPEHRPSFAVIYQRLFCLTKYINVCFNFTVNEQLVRYNYKNLYHFSYLDTVQSSSTHDMFLHRNDECVENRAVKRLVLLCFRQYQEHSGKSERVTSMKRIVVFPYYVSIVSQDHLQWTYTLYMEKLNGQQSHFE